MTESSGKNSSKSAKVLLVAWSSQQCRQNSRIDQGKDCTCCNLLASKFCWENFIGGFVGRINRISSTSTISPSSTWSEQSCWSALHQPTPIASGHWTAPAGCFSINSSKSDRIKLYHCILGNQNFVKKMSMLQFHTFLPLSNPWTPLSKLIKINYILRVQNIYIC